MKLRTWSLTSFSKALDNGDEILRKCEISEGEGVFGTEITLEDFQQCGKPM